EGLDGASRHRPGHGQRAGLGAGRALPLAPLLLRLAAGPQAGGRRLHAVDPGGERPVRGAGGHPDDGGGGPGAGLRPPPPSGSRPGGRPGGGGGHVPARRRGGRRRRLAGALAVMQPGAARPTAERSSSVTLPREGRARVLVADPLAEDGVDRLRAAADVEVRTKLPEADLVALVGDFDALVVRSETKVT